MTSWQPTEPGPSLRGSCIETRWHSILTAEMHPASRLGDSMLSSPSFSSCPLVWQQSASAHAHFPRIASPFYVLLFWGSLCFPPLTQQFYVVLLGSRNSRQVHLERFVGACSGAGHRQSEPPLHFCRGRAVAKLASSESDPFHPTHLLKTDSGIDDSVKGPSPCQK